MTTIIVVATLSTGELDSPRQKLVKLNEPQSPPAPPSPPPTPNVPPPSPNSPPSSPAGRRLEEFVVAMRRSPAVVWTDKGL